MDYFEKRIDGEEKYNGVIVRVRLDRAELVNGAVVKREVVEHPGGVCILPVDEQGNCYMVRQFRYPFSRMMLEAPAGKLEYGEDHRDCAVRELSEETGFTAAHYTDLGRLYPSPGYCRETLYIYMATGLTRGQAHLDKGEFLDVEKHSLDELYRMAMAGDLPDAKTAMAVIKAWLLQRGKD